jgi:hypothetical protein
MKAILFMVSGLLAPAALYAQAKAPAHATKAPVHAPAAKAPAPAAVASAATEPADAAPIPLAPVTPPADPNALKIKAEYNPIGHILSVKCDAPGPTRIEINDKDGRPVLTKNVIAGTASVPFKVASLPAGPYVVRCTAGEKMGTRLVQLGN